MSTPTTEVEELLTADERRVSIREHEAFRELLEKPAPVDPIDELVEELRAAEFEERGAEL